MINCFQRTLRKIVSQPKFRLTTLNSSFSGSIRRLNYNFSMSFCFQKRQDYVIDKNGMVQLGENVIFDQVYQYLQEDILKRIKVFEASDSDQKLESILQISGFFQAYMESWPKISRPKIFIDNQILKFAENLLNEINATPNVQNNTITNRYLMLQILQIQVKFIRFFESLPIQKILLIQERYQELKELQYQNKLENPKLSVRRDDQIESQIEAYEKIFYYHPIENLIKKKNIQNYHQKLELASSSITQLVLIFEQVKMTDVEEKIKILIMQYVIRIIEYVLQKFEMLRNTYQIDLLLEVQKTEIVIESFKFILPLEYYVQTKLNCIMKFIKLGYMEKALKSALDLYDLRFHIKSKQAVMLYYSQLYYCLRKTENTNYDLDLLIEEIDPKGMNNDDLKIYQQLVCIQQLHNLIKEQKYHKIESIIDIIFFFGDRKESQNLLLLPLLFDAIIFNRQLQIRLDQIKSLKDFWNEKFPYDTFYLINQRNLYKCILDMYSCDGKLSFYFFCYIYKRIKIIFANKYSCIKSKEDLTNFFLKQISAIESQSTYEKLVEIIDFLTLKFQNDTMQEWKKQIDLLNSHKMKLQQKYSITEK